MALRFVLVRHGETAWNRTGQHTGHTDLPLTDDGRAQADTLGPRLAGYGIERVVASPLARARETAERAGLGLPLELDPDLMEWHYGRAEGRTKADLRAELPGWDIWRDGPPDGEPIAALVARAERAHARLAADRRLTAVFSHGHFLRVFAAAWVGWPPSHARALALGNASIALLGDEDGTRVVRAWNL